MSLHTTELSTLLKTLRLEHGLTRRELGQRLDCPVNKDTVKDWELGRKEPNLERLAQVCRVFGLD